MNRYRSYWPNDDAPKTDGDSRWLGVDEKTEPALLPPGYMSSARNCRFRAGHPETRGGDTIWPWMRSDGMTKFGTVFCAVQFSDLIDGSEWIVVAADSGVWATRPNNVAKSVALPAGVTLTAATCIQLVQCFNVLVMLRGEDTAPLVCAAGLDTGFTTITQTGSGTGTEAIPNSAFGLFFANRLLLIHERDQVAASDALDYTRYSPTLASFRINQGDNDALVSVAAFNESTLIMLKDQSVWRVDNVYGDLSSVALRKITSQYGCIAPRSVVQFGTDLAWFSERGVETLKLTELNQVQARAAALSDKMTATIARVNWKYASGIKSAFWDGKLYFAVPLDDANVVDDVTNLLSGLTYDSVPADGSGRTVQVTSFTAGATYRYRQGANDTFFYSYNGTDITIYRGDCYFVGPSVYAYFYGTPSTSVTATVYQVLAEGVNNAVMVFDTETGEWCGTDEHAGLNIKEWVIVTHQGVQRLGYISGLGEFHLYEEGPCDEKMGLVASNYSDVLVTNYPANAQTIRLNAGDIVTSSTGDLLNTPGNTWGTGTLTSLAQTNLWSDGSVGAFGGFLSTGAAPWSANGATTAQINGGVRVFSTTLAINGSSVTSSRGFYGTSGAWGAYQSWAFADLHSGTEIQPVDIETYFKTRGYLCEDIQRKRYQRMAVRLATWSPTYTLALIADGVGESATAISGRTRSRTTYYTAAAAWTETNANDDWANPYRQDYSVVPDADGVSMGTGTGINFDQQQDAEEVLTLDSRGVTLQLEMTNTTGTIGVKSVAMAAQTGERSNGTRA